MSLPPLPACLDWPLEAAGVAPCPTAVPLAADSVMSADSPCLAPAGLEVLALPAVDLGEPSFPEESSDAASLCTALSPSPLCHPPAEAPHSAPGSFPVGRRVLGVPSAQRRGEVFSKRSLNQIHDFQRARSPWTEAWTEVL